MAYQKKKRRQRPHLFPLEQRPLLHSEHFGTYGKVSRAKIWFLGVWVHGNQSLRLHAVTFAVHHQNRKREACNTANAICCNNKHDFHTAAETLLLLANSHSIPIEWGCNYEKMWFYLENKQTKPPPTFLPLQNLSVDSCKLGFSFLTLRGGNRRETCIFSRVIFVYMWGCP